MSSADVFVYQQSTLPQVESEIPFVKKDWLNINDMNNGSYTSNQCVIETSQLSNSNKYMSYKEAYLLVPMVLTASSVGNADPTILTAPNTPATSAGFTFGLKNWFGSIVHSLSCELNGVQVLQQSNHTNLYNLFRLLTTLSWQDVAKQGAHMGFYPDDALSFSFIDGANGLSSVAGSLDGVGTCNNRNNVALQTLTGANPNGKGGNKGFLKRQNYICFDPAGIPTAGSSAYSVLAHENRLMAQFKSYIKTKTNATAGTPSVIQYKIVATIHLRHLHSMFSKLPLMKGAFFKIILNLNNSVVRYQRQANTNADYRGVQVSVQNAFGGTSPIMIASKEAGNGSASSLLLNTVAQTLSMTVSLAVGSKPIIADHSGLPIMDAPDKVQLYVPAYTLNSSFESAYLSRPIKKIVYTDIYQYDVFNIGATSQFNQLITNGISNIKSITILPFYTRTENAGLLPYQSPFDCCGGGTTSPLVSLTNFNVVVAGQNMMNNNQNYGFESFLNNLYEHNAINGGLIDGLSNGLIDKLSFEHKYCYYYVDCSRTLPSDKEVAKSISITGTNNSSKAIDLVVFIEYENKFNINILNGMMTQENESTSADL